MGELPATRSQKQDVRRMRRLVVSKSSLYIWLTAVLFLSAHGGLYRFGAATGIVWTLATAISAAWFLRSPRSMSQLLARHWAILLLPCFAILSTLWSGSRTVTLIDSVQMLITVIISLKIVTVLDTRQILVALAIGMGGATAFSVLNLATGFLPPVYEMNGAFLGIFTQKNNLAKAVFWGAFAISALSLIYGRPFIGVIVAAISFPLTLIALSKTGQIGYGFIVLLYALALIRHLPGTARIVLPLFFGLSLLAMSLTYVLTGGALIEDTLALMGKSPTLTGRTVIWGLGLDVWRSNFLVGIGLSTFWSSPTFADQVNFIAANVDDGLHGFHNVYIEYLVALGLIGGAYLAGLMGLSWIRLFRGFLKTRSIDMVIWLAILTTLIVFGGFEDSFSKPRSGHLMLAIMAFSFAQHGLIISGRDLGRGAFP